MSTPMENQQTVEALAAKIEQGMSSYMLAPDGAVCLNTNYNDARAALRDLVAQAANAAELRRALTDIFLDPLTSHGGRARAREALGISFIPFASPQEMLARLDGAR